MRWEAKIAVLWIESRRPLALATGLIALALAFSIFSADASTHSRATSILSDRIASSGRPANLYRLDYSADQQVCDLIGLELAKPNGPALRDANYFRVALLHTKYSVSWTAIPTTLDSMSISRADIDIDNDRAKEAIYRVSWPSGSGDYEDRLYWNPANTELEEITSADTLSRIEGGVVDHELLTTKQIAIYSVFDSKDPKKAFGSGAIPADRLIDILTISGKTYIIYGAANLRNELPEATISLVIDRTQQKLICHFVTAGASQ